MLRWYLERETEAQIDEWELEATEQNEAFKEAWYIIARFSDYDKKRIASAWIVNRDDEEEDLCKDFFSVDMIRNGVHYVLDENGEAVDFDAAVSLMDDELREGVHDDLSPCTEQDFYTEYARRHYERYGEPFTV